MADYGSDQTGEAKAQVSAQPWCEKLEAYRRTVENKWETQRKNLDKLYSKDERADSADREYSIFWANIEVLKPSVYARTPVPVVAPRFKQPNPMASAASEALERCLVTTFERSDLDGCMREVRDEFLRYARGTGWVRLGKERNDAPCIEFDHVSAEDFAHDPQRTWRKVKWVAKREWLTRDKGVARFGEIFNSVPLKKRDQNSAVSSPEDQAPVWEIWDSDGNQVLWVCEDYCDVLDVREPWLDLTLFWPCPKPAFGTLVPKKLQPVPDIRQYKDQIEEINEYTARIAALSEQLRLKGFYPAGAAELGDAIEAALKDTDNRAVLVPVASWAAMGGVAPKDMVIWLPLEQVIALIQGLVELRRVVIDDVYQITGISDIVRGDTDPDETLGAQRLKSQWGSVRIRDKQAELARFARDMTRIAGEIISENYPPEVIAEMAQMEMGEEFAQVAAFLANDRARGFVIEIETDSTIQPDEDAEKNRRVEFVTAVGGLFQQAAPIVMQAPQLGPFMGEVLKFAAQGFRAGRPLEAAIENMSQMMGQMAQQAASAQPPPDPKVEAEKAKIVAAQQQAQLDSQRDQEKHALDIQSKQADMAMKRELHAFEMQSRQDDLALKREEMQMGRQTRAEEVEFMREERQGKREDRSFEREAAQEKRQQELDAVSNPPQQPQPEPVDLTPVLKAIEGLDKRLDRLESKKDQRITVVRENASAH